MSASEQDPVLGSQYTIDAFIFERSALLKTLHEAGLFTIEASFNKLYLPVDKALADQMGCSQFSPQPVASYYEAMLEHLKRIEDSADGQAAMQLEAGALQRVAESVEKLQLTVKAALINGDLFLG